MSYLFKKKLQIKKEIVSEKKLVKINNYEHF